MPIPTKPMRVLLAIGGKHCNLGAHTRLLDITEALEFLNQRRRAPRRNALPISAGEYGTARTRLAAKRAPQRAQHSKRKAQPDQREYRGAYETIALVALELAEVAP